MSKSDLIKQTISETALLNRYLKSRGINPEFVSKDQKVAHSKTNQFKTWMVAHANDPIKEGLSTEPTPANQRLATFKKSIHVNKEIRVAGADKQLHSEAVDKKDTITFDIPLLIRVLEFAREELKSDILLHKMVERLINIRGKGTLTMNQYGKIVKEEFSHLSEERIDEISKDLANRYMYSAMSDRKRTDDKMFTLRDRQDTLGHNNRNKISKLLKKSDKRTTGISRALDRVTKEEVEKMDESSQNTLTNMVMGAAKSAGIKATVAKPAAERKKDTDDMLKKRADADKAAGIKRPLGGLYSKEYHPRVNKEEVETVQEVSSELLGSYKEKAKKSADELHDQGNYGKAVKRYSGVMKATGKQIEKTTANIKKALKKENLEPMAACNQPGDGANTPDDVAPKRSSKLKLLLGGKKGAIKEELYDTEKEDKPVTTPGKKVKFQKPGVDPDTKETPQASAVLSGGKTLTGEPRDTIEIDPMMKMRKQSPEAKKSV